MFLGSSFIAAYIFREAHKCGNDVLYISPADLRAVKNEKKSFDDGNAFSKKVIRGRLHDSSSLQPDGTLSPQTAQEDHFIYLSLSSPALYTSLKNLPE